MTPAGAVAKYCTWCGESVSEERRGGEGIEAFPFQIRETSLCYDLAAMLRKSYESPKQFVSNR